MISLEELKETFQPLEAIEYGSVMPDWMCSSKETQKIARAVLELIKEKEQWIKQNNK